MQDTGDKLWHFHGGLHLPSHKSMSMDCSLRRLPAPPRLVLPLHQHIGETLQPLVERGEYVCKGQKIARSDGYLSAPVHASSSGTVVEIGPRPIPHPSGLDGECIVIETDGREDWGDTRLPPIEDYASRSSATLRNRVRQCGIVGLGGAAFPTAAKLNPLPENTISTLILNGVECEPYITCDDMLMRERSEEIIRGARILSHTLGDPLCIIAIESDMPGARNAICEALGGEEDHGIRVVTVPTRYPSGSERQLIQVLTGREVPADGLPADIGVICQNVGTAYAVYRAVVYGEPLLSRIVTVTGRGVKAPCNLEVLLGTPVADVIDACGGYTPQMERLIMGGPMMGVALHDDAVPVVKATNCLLNASRGEIDEPVRALPCIRCGECVRVCPARLLPQELYRYARARDLDKVQGFNLFDCIECGCCAYVCPSRIPLVAYYRFAKTEIRDQEREHQAAELARRRHEFRLERLEREKRERAQRMARRKAAVAGKDAGASDRKAAIAAAVARAEARKAGTGPGTADEGHEPTGSVEEE